ncbi:MAG: xanthine dehydrogenase family protein molybdopterin-binding subunit [Betaproteobacteria bacterium]|nr:xanthine dehydrogenase family protein molybdopterin-binding subunit [Betaproteobacteria bacterium]
MSSSPSFTPPATQFDPASARFGASRTQKRLEDDRLLHGQGRFSDDVDLPGQAWMVVLRSPHAHARIASIDADEARKAPGVLAIYTAADLAADGIGPIPFPPLFKRADGSPMAAPARTLLADGVAFYAGIPVVAVVAQTRVQAQDAAELVMVAFEELPCVVSPAQAIAPGAPPIWPAAPGNVSAETRYGYPGAVADAMAKAPHVVQIEIANQRVSAMPLEPRCALAEFKDGRWTLITQTQQPTGTREGLAAAFKVSSGQFRVRVGDLGGGFGMKTGLSQEDALACYAARKLARPVKWRADRSEDFLAAHMGRDLHCKATLALNSGGRILALKLEALGNFGSVPVGSTAIVPLMLMPKVVTSVYRVPLVDFWIRGVLTNTMATGAYRGAGRPEANFLMERLMDKAARQLQLDPAEIRRRNFIPPGAFPARTHMGDVYDAGEFARMLEGVMKAADWDGYAARKMESAQRGRLRGRGLASYLEWTGALPTETVDIEVAADGTVTVFSGTMAMGQGLETTYTQLITEVLGVAADKIRIVQGDTDRANGVGSVGSRSAFVGGSAVVAAGHTVVARGRELAAEQLEAAPRDIEYRDGKFSIAGTDRGIGMAELAGRQAQKIIRVSATQTPSSPSWPNGAQAIEVEIDPETGLVELAKITSCDDIGRIINRTIVEGQVHGGVAQGAGQALWEQAVYDEDSGQLLTGSLMDYCVPRADQFPPMRAEFDEGVPCKTNLLGVKGVGELGTIGASPATVSAVLDALADRGRGGAHVDLDMPLTPEKVWQALNR